MKPVPVLVKDAGGARCLMHCNSGPQPIILCEKKTKIAQERGRIAPQRPSVRGAIVP